MRLFTLNALFTATLVLVLANVARADDWPQFLGPTRNGAYTGKAIVDDLPATGPTIVWRRKLGEGFASPVIAGGKLVIFHRQGERNVLDCLDAATGKEIWTQGYDTDYLDDMRKGNGPRGTPAMTGGADGKIVALGPEGVLHCVDVATSKTLWQNNLVKMFRSQQGFFGRGCSPLIDDGRVLINIGGPQAGVGAFDLKTGELLWKAGTDEMGYASPVSATIDEQRYAFFFTRTGLVAADPKSGDVLFQHRFRSRQHASVNAASPLVVGNLVMLSSSYETGATVLAVKGKEFETLWSSDAAISSQYANLVQKDGFVYGFDGRNDFGDTKLRCIELKTGKVRWSQDGLPAGPIVLAGEKLVIVLENGDLFFVKASPEGFKEIARKKLLREPVRANVALVDGLLFARDEAELVCVDLRAK